MIEFGGVHLFALTLNGEHLELDSQGKPQLKLNETLDMLKVYLENFPDVFWDHFVVIITNWGNALQWKKRRLKKGITDEIMIDLVNQFLNEKFPT